MTAATLPRAPLPGLSALCLAAILVLAIASWGTRPTSTPGSPDAGAASPRDADLPLAFQPSAGRFGAEVDYASATTGGDVILGRDGATIELAGGGSPIGIGVAGGRLVEPEAARRLPGVVNDLRGDDPAGHVTGIPTYREVVYRDVYPGIDLAWHGRSGTLEYDLRLDAGADPGRIAFTFAGAEPRLTPSGDLILTHDEGTIRIAAPVSWQGGAESRTPVPSAFAIRGDEVGFELGAYDSSRPLVIDPVVLEYSTYLGGNGADYATALAIDSNGSAYLVGTTTSTDFNVAGSIEADSGDGTDDVFVSKLNPAGNALVYSTYIGGSSRDFGGDIAVDQSGAAYVTGATESTDFNTVGAIEGVQGGGDAFVAKLTPSGSSLAYSTYLGGAAPDPGTSSYDFATAIAVDSSGAAYVAGGTWATDFNRVGGIEGDSEGYDGFVSKLSPSGGSLAYSTYLGGNAYDDISDIAVDGSGSAYVTGSTDSTNFDTVGPAQGNSLGGDAFVGKLNPAGNALAYSTYLGGNGHDRGYAIAVDSGGSAYAVGSTNSNDFQTVNPIEGRSPGGFNDAFLVKLTAAGSGFAYSTLLGGSDDDSALTVTVDSRGAAYVGGQTRSTDFDTVSPYEGDSLGGDAFVSKVNPGGSSLAYSTYLGGNGPGGGMGTTNDYAADLAVDADGAVFAAGMTGSPDFDTVNPIEGDSNVRDAFVSKLPNPIDTAISAGPDGPTGDPTPTFELSSPAAGASFACAVDGGPFAPCSGPGATHTTAKLGDGPHTLRVIASDTTGNVDLTPAQRAFSIDACRPARDSLAAAVKKLKRAKKKLKRARGGPKPKLKKAKKAVKKAKAGVKRGEAAVKESC